MVSHTVPKRPPRHAISSRCVSLLMTHEKEFDIFQIFQIEGKRLRQLHFCFSVPEVTLRVWSPLRVSWLSAMVDHPLVIHFSLCFRTCVTQIQYNFPRPSNSFYVSSINFAGIMFSWVQIQIAMRIENTSMKMFVEWETETKLVSGSRGVKESHSNAL